MFARTPRLLLRPGWTEDAAVLHTAIADPAIIRNLARAPWPLDLANAQSFLANDWDPRHPNFLIFSRTRGAPRLVGGCGIRALADDEKELVYWIARPFWGLGFATEATCAVMNIARSTGIQNVGASHTMDNPAAGRVLTKIGFRQTGRSRMVHILGRGHEVKSVYYEDSGIAPLRDDSSHELYEDQSVAA